MNFRRSRSALALSTALALGTGGLLACGQTTSDLPTPAKPGDKVDVNATDDGPRRAVDKLDLLFVVDNSASMGDKQVLLRRAIPDLVERLVRPRCLDGAGRAIGRATISGTCTEGRPEFLPLRDMHVGFISSSLGARGGDQCAANEALRHNDDRAHLLNRELAVSQAAPSGLLAWLPDVPENAGKPRDPSAIGATPFTSVDELTAAAQAIVSGIGEDGCGYEAPLEAAYRFLVQPDPYQAIVKSGDAVRYDGFDDELLKQRKAFLRPDSAVAVIVLTDENESNVAPLAFGGRSWLFSDSKTVRPGTGQCNVDPTSDDCMSCYLAMAARRDPAACGTTLDESTDHPNVRFFDMKPRFGVDPRYPVARYVDGLRAAKVPSRDEEYAGFDYAGATKRSCVNPLFAATLPSGGVGEELCALTPGVRKPQDIYLAVIGGVPWQLLTEAPDDLSAGNAAPFKASLDDSDWRRLLGADPDAYRFEGQHPLMKESIEPRFGAGRDDAHMREWQTRRRDLQYACTFPLEAPVDCTQPDKRDFCDCADPSDSPVCDAKNPAMQIAAKAYPSIRALQVAKGLGGNAVVGSICPREPRDRSSESYGYRPTLEALVDRMAASFVKP